MSDETTTLYNRYRPLRFADVLGQEKLVAGLRNAVREDRLTHAYLFSGPRGCGKTTTARITAAAINCPIQEQRGDGEPCTECDNCKATYTGTFVGVVQELNAAQNRGIDDIRQLLYGVSLGVGARKKVYIVDEVHRLTQDAASALLKTLEEPPPNVIFILATTDPQQLLPTIRSRCVPIPFRLIEDEVLSELVTSVAGQESIEVTPSQIQSLVGAGRGSARDTLSALEQFKLGVSDDRRQVLVELLTHMLDRDVAGLMTTIAVAAREGQLDSRDLGLGIQVLWRDALIHQQDPGLVHPEPGTEELVARAAQESPARVSRAIETISTALGSIKESVAGRALLEATLVRLTLPAARSTQEDILDEMACLTEKMDLLQEQMRDVVELMKNPTIDTRPLPPSAPPVVSSSIWSDEPAPTAAVTSIVPTSEPPVTPVLAPVESAPAGSTPDSPSELEVPSGSRIEEAPPTRSWTISELEERWETLLEGFRGRNKVILDAAVLDVTSDGVPVVLLHTSLKVEVQDQVSVLLETPVTFHVKEGGGR